MSFEQMVCSPLTHTQMMRINEIFIIIICYINFKRNAIKLSCSPNIPNISMHIILIYKCIYNWITVKTATFGHNTPQLDAYSQEFC